MNPYSAVSYAPQFARGSTPRSPHLKRDEHEAFYKKDLITQSLKKGCWMEVAAALHGVSFGFVEKALQERLKRLEAQIEAIKQMREVRQSESSPNKAQRILSEDERLRLYLPEILVNAFLDGHRIEKLANYHGLSMDAVEQVLLERLQRLEGGVEVIQRV